MRTTIDIPDETYKSIKRIAVEDETTVRQMVLDGLSLLLQMRKNRPVGKKLDLPLIRSTRGEVLDIDNEKIYELIDFP